MTEKMPYIEGVNWDKAFQYIPDMELMKEVLEELVSTEEENNRKLLELKQAVAADPSELNFKNYTIQAHSMKSNLRSLGAELAKEALFLEEAGKKGALEDILAKTEPFTGNYKALMGKMKKILDGEGTAEEGRAAENLTAVDKAASSAGAASGEEVFFVRVDELMKAAAAFNIGGMQQAMESLRGMQVEEKYGREIPALAEAVRDLDTEVAEQLCRRLLSLRG